MRKANFTALSITNANSGAQNGSRIDTGQTVSISFHAVFSSATAGGTLKVQASNDISSESYAPDSVDVTNWVDVPTQTVVVATGTSTLLTISQCSYRWLRLVWTGTGGGGTVIVNAFELSI